MTLLSDRAGMSLVDAHGAAEAQRMLPLFEGYLEKQAVGNEEMYDRVRQAAVVFLGTLARHMEPGSAKVCRQDSNRFRLKTVLGSFTSLKAQACLGPSNIHRTVNAHHELT